MAEKLSNTAFMRELSNTANIDDVEKALIDDMEERDSQRMPKSIQKLLVEERRKRDIRNGVVKPTPTEAREAILRTHGRDALSDAPRGNTLYGPETQFPEESGLGGFFDKGLNFMQTAKDDGFLAATDALDPNSVGARARARKARRAEVARVNTPEVRPSLRDVVVPTVEEAPVAPALPSVMNGMSIDPVTGQVVQASPMYSTYADTQPVERPSIATKPSTKGKAKAPKRDTFISTPSKAVGPSLADMRALQAQYVQPQSRHQQNLDKLVPTAADFGDDY